MPGHVSLETLTFEERDGKTPAAPNSVFQSVADRDGMIESGMESRGYEPGRVEADGGALARARSSAQANLRRVRQARSAALAARETKLCTGPTRNRR